MSEQRIKLMQGNEACAEAALAAGLTFFAGYPITPSSEIAEHLALELPRRGGTFIQMEDEIASMAAIIGASLTGAKAMTATSGPGFSLKQENIGYAAMVEVPCVIVNVQRGGPSTGLPTLPAQGDVMQARWGTHGDHPAIVLSASSVPEIYRQTIRCFNLAEKYRTPVTLLLDEITGHLNEKIEIPDPGSIEIIDRVKPTCAPEDYLPYDGGEHGVPPMASFGEGYRYHVSGLCHDETGFPTADPVKIERLLRRLVLKVEKNVDDIVEVDTYMLDDAEVVVFAYGGTARSARRAVADARAKGIKVGLMRPMVLWPFPEKQVREIAGKVSAIIVPELNLGQLAHEVEHSARGQAEVVKLCRVDGEPIRPKQIEELIGEVA